jgi:hypothetical protein
LEEGEGEARAKVADYDITTARAHPTETASYLATRKNSTNHHNQNKKYPRAPIRQHARRRALGGRDAPRVLAAADA